MIGTANDTARVILGLKTICNVLCHVIFVKGQGLCMIQQGSCLLVFIISLCVYLCSCREERLWQYRGVQYQSSIGWEFGDLVYVLNDTVLRLKIYLLGC